MPVAACFLGDTITMNKRLISCAGLLAATMLLGACGSARDNSAIRKVQAYHLKTDKPSATKDRMIQSETQSRMWGAITNAERAERFGNYYTAHWSTKDTTTPAKVRIEYRQANTGAKLYSQEIDYPTPARHNKTEFTITGAAYHTQGRVVSWRIQVIQGNEVIGQETSFLWE